MQNHPNQARCFELITETTRLRMAIEEQEEREGMTARINAARLWMQFHRAMLELLALTPAHDADAARRQEATGKAHQAQQMAWGRMLEQLEEQAALERQA